MAPSNAAQTVSILEKDVRRSGQACVEELEFPARNSYALGVAGGEPFMPSTRMEH